MAVLSVTQLGVPVSPRFFAAQRLFPGTILLGSDPNSRHATKMALPLGASGVDYGGRSSWGFLGGTGTPACALLDTARNGCAFRDTARSACVTGGR